MNYPVFFMHIMPLIASFWGPLQEPQFIRNNANLVLEARMQDSSVIVRLTDPAKKTKQWLHEELAFLDFLARNECAVPVPMVSCHGNFVEEITCEGKNYYVVVMSKLMGRYVEKSDVTPELARACGAFLGKLHRLSKQYTAQHLDARYHWDACDEIVHANTYIPQDDEVMQQEYSNLMAWLRSLPCDSSCYGLIHADACLDSNFYINKSGTLLSFDYDDLQHNWFANDLAVCLASVQNYSFKSAAELTAIKQEIIDGYHAENPLDEIWYRRIDLFIRLRSFYFYSSIHKKLAQGIKPAFWWNDHLKWFRKRVIKDPFVAI